MLCDWSSFPEAKYVYDNTKKSSMSKKLIADAIAFRRFNNQIGTSSCRQERNLGGYARAKCRHQLCNGPNSIWRHGADESTKRRMLKEQSKHFTYHGLATSDRT